jgi:peroxiredoxin Q/BCP
MSEVLAGEICMTPAPVMVSMTVWLTPDDAAPTITFTPVLSDPDLAVSRAYHANDYGMMGTRRDGHTFIVVGPDGRIQWRADYGGAPAYTMYVPVDVLVADLRRGLHRDK